MDKRKPIGVRFLLQKMRSPTVGVDADDDAEADEAGAEPLTSLDIELFTPAHNKFGKRETRTLSSHVEGAIRSCIALRARTGERTRTSSHAHSLTVQQCDFFAPGNASHGHSALCADSRPAADT